MKRFALSLLACALLALSATATAGAATLYAVGYNNDETFAFNSDANGLLTLIAGSPFSLAAGGTTSFTPTPDGRFGFTTYLFNGGVRAFAIDPAGAVSPVQDKIPSVEGSSGAIAPDGKTFYVAGRDPSAGGATEPDGAVYAWSIAADGTLSAVAGSPFGTDEVGDVVITPDGKYVFAAGLSSVKRFSVGAGGALSPLADAPITLGIALTVSPDGRHLFVAREPGGGSDEIRSYAIGTDGSLTEVGTPWQSGDVSLDPPSISPNGRFLYACDGNADSFFAIAVNPDGSLGQVGAPIPFEDCAITSVSPDGRWIYVNRTSSPPSGLHVAALGADGRPGPFTFTADYDAGENVRIPFRPGQGTVAAVTSKPETKLLSVRFDGGASTANSGSVARYEWDFGDGTALAAGPAAPVHQYKKAGVYDVRLTTYDELGCSGLVHDGHFVLCNGTAAGTKAFKFDTPAWITSLTVKPKSVGRRSAIKYKLSEKARVTFTVEKPVAGRVSGGKCKRQTAKNRKGKRCKVWVRAAKSFRANGRAGKTNRLKFTGKVGKKRLARGKYRLKAVAVDSGKTKSAPRTAAFRVR